MAKEADLFAEARGGVHTCVNRGQRYNRGAAPSQNKTGASRPSGKPEIKCNICGKGHLTIKCFKHPNRVQVNSAELGSDTKQDKRSNSDASNAAQGRMQVKSDNYQNKGRGDSHSCGRGSFRGRGRGNNPSRGGHQ